MKTIIVKRQKRKSSSNLPNVEPMPTYFENVFERMLTIRIVAALLRITDQYRHPRGFLGRHVAKLMNQDHEPLTLWGLTKVKIASCDVILDVGCGGGKIFSRLAQLAPHGKVFGIDHSTDMVEFSKKINAKLIAENRVEILEESVEKMSFKDCFFDLVTAFETYYFWVNFSDALREIKRVLKKGGKLLLVNEMIQNGVCEIENAKLIEKAHVRLIPLQKMQTIMLSMGFTYVKVFTKNKSSWNVIIAQK